MPVVLGAELRIQDRCYHAANHHGDDHVGQLAQITFGEDAGDQRDDAYAQHPGLDVLNVRAELDQHLMKMGAARHVEAEEVLDLAGGDENRRTCGEADDDGVRDEVDQCAEPRQTHRQLNQAGQQGECKHQADELRTARFGQRADRGKHHDRDCGCRARHQVPARAPQRARQWRAPSLRINRTRAAGRRWWQMPRPAAAR